jgi:hypothetical protein
MASPADGRDRSAQRVADDVGALGQEVLVGVDEQYPESALEQSHAIVQAVELLRVDTVQLSHPARESRVGRLQEW